MYQSSTPCCWSRSNTTKSTYKIKMEKEIIERSKEVRRDMTDFNKLVKFLKKQAESKPSTVTITKVGNQLVLMGNGGVIDSLDKKTGEKIIKAFEAAEYDTTFVSNYQIRLPKLFADLRLLKKKKIWTAKMMQAQALTYFCILGFGVGGFRFNSFFFSSSISSPLLLLCVSILFLVLLSPLFLLPPLLLLLLTRLLLLILFLLQLILIQVLRWWRGAWLLAGLLDLEWIQPSVWWNNGSERGCYQSHLEVL